jgi:hypothetical protein
MFSRVDSLDFFLAGSPGFGRRVLTLHALLLCGLALLGGLDCGQSRVLTLELVKLVERFSGPSTVTCSGDLIGLFPLHRQSGNNSCE